MEKHFVSIRTKPLRENENGCPPLGVVMIVTSFTPWLLIH